MSVDYTDGEYKRLMAIKHGKKPDNKTTIVSVCVYADMKACIAEVCRQKDITQSELIRDAIDSYLLAHEVEQLDS